MPDRKSIVQVKFRLRKDILRQLERSAKAYDRSVNAEIAHRLEQSLEQEDMIKAVKETVESKLDQLGRAVFFAGFKDGLLGADIKDEAQLAAGLKRALRDAGFDPDKPEGEDKS